MLELNRILFFQQKFVNKNKFLCSDNNLSESTSPRLSFSSPNDHNKDDNGNDNVDNVVDAGGDEDIDKVVDYESFNSEDEWELNSLIENYRVVRK